jgi:DeoR family myo-inositol catabolism operon transcriptional repressor
MCMLKHARLMEMERFVLEQESVSMEALQERFGISLNTVRRDVALLLKRGMVEKVYGGVRARRLTALTSFGARAEREGEAKALVARRGAELVADGDILFVDSGTTALHLARHLKERRNVTVVTHSLYFMVEAMACPGVNVITLPGMLQRDTASFTGAETLRALNAYNIKTAFMAATGLSLSRGATNASPLEYEIKRGAMARSARAVLLMDSSKFGQTGLNTYAQLEQFYALVTEKAPEEYARALGEAGVKVLLAR